MIRAAIYMRVSSDRQALEGDSIPAQRDALLKYIDNRPDMVLAGEYLDDGVSGTKSDRDELNRLLDDVRAGKIDRILITKLDRLYRSIKHYLNMMDVLDAHGVTWTAIWESYDTSTPQGRLVINSMMSFAEYEAANAGSRVRQVFRHKVQQGEAITGSTPAGFRIKDKHLVHSDDAESVRQAFAAYSRTGSINQTMRICAGLPGLPHTKPPFKKMLTNPLYVGEYRGNPEYCEPIIDRALFDDVQRQIRINVKKSQTHTYVFSGLIRCNVCGRAMAGNARIKRGKMLLQYRCAGHFNHRPALCRNPKVMYEAVLEKYMMAQLRPSIEDLVLKYEVESANRNDVVRQKKNLEKRLDKLKELFLSDLITLDEYKKDRERLQTEINAIPEIPQQTDLSDLKSLLNTNVEELYQTFTPEERRRFWRGIVEEIRFGADREAEIVWRTK